MLENIFGGELKDKIEKRTDGGVVVRPDSGDPAEMVLRTLTILGDKFGTSLNGQGYKILPPCISVIQGDGICYESIEKILSTIKESGWSAENLVFGSGGALLQRLDRDTQKCAYKCSYVEVNGQGRQVYKDPITDPGKKSKGGRLALVKADGEFTTISEDEARSRGQQDEMEVVFQNGELIKDWSLKEVRARAWKNATKS